MTTNRLRAAAIVIAMALAAPGAIWVSAQEPPAQVAGRIALTAGRSTVLTTTFDIVRIAVTNPEVADAVAVAPREILVDGRKSGTISLIVWGDGSRAQYDIVVDQPVTALQQQLSALFPGEDIQVTINGEAITLSGHVSSTSIMLRAAEIAAKTAANTKVINLLAVPGGTDSQQVLLQVRFAEVNRQALTEAGVSLFTGTTGYKDFVGRATTGQFAAPNFTGTIGNTPGVEGGLLTFSDFLNLFLFNTKYDVGGLLKALQTKGFLQSLAEPNLVAYNGREASFLAGGEVPVPVVGAGFQGQAMVTVVYKEFGIRLNFTPTIAGDVIRLFVRPEVSTLDFSNGVTLSGFRIPALQTRRAETEIELRDGQSFAIAGLMNNVSQNDRQQIPLLGTLPIVGYLFKSRSERLARTELMVLVTPHLVRPLNPDEVPQLPTDDSRFMPPEDAGSQLQGGGGTVDAPPAGNRQ